MGFSERLRAWLRGERSLAPARGRDRSGGAFDGAELLAFARARRGVEAYLEPRTNLYGSSVLLVADDGECLRRPVPDPAALRRLCAEHGIPVYDAARTGYPRRVREYDRGVRPDAVSLDDLPPWPTDGEGGSTDDEPPPHPPVAPSAP